MNLARPIALNMISFSDKNQNDLENQPSKSDFKNNPNLIQNGDHDQHHARLSSEIKPHDGHFKAEKINVNYTGHNAASLAAQLAQDPLDKDFMPMQFNEGFGHVERVRRWEDHLDDLSRSAREQAKKRKDNDEKKRKMEQELNNVEHQL